MEQESLFANQVEEPLANRVRPTNLDQFVGHDFHFLNHNGIVNIINQIISNLKKRAK
ncbi:MAG TPA: hypothetical protein K8W06_00960 [Limosilactobacillus coleohominis]|nr:hypothetical protein [Limosilactobacillus coleohominis]